MRDARLRSGVLAAVAWLLVLALPDTAKADAISVKMVTTVPAGQQPRLTITALQPVDKVEVLLNRDDGKMVDETIGDLGAGGWRDVMLDAAVGKHKYSGRITCVLNGKPSATQVEFETVVSGVLTVVLDKSRVDIAHGRLDMQVSIPEGKVELKIISATDGATLVDHEQSFSDHAPRDPLVVKWNPQAKDAEVGRVDVRVSDPSGAFQSYSLFPWQVYIPHEEVNFATDSAAIAPLETPKLQASLAKIIAVHSQAERQGHKPTLYLAGRTDTVGTAQHNLDLSRRRALSIASWFRKNGLRIPVAYEGFGEQALYVITPDNTDEPRNRRVDYYLSDEEPSIKATDFRPVWKTIK
jgi:outer membrane protein OmpA-like peptidoglycan-associated protein